MTEWAIDLTAFPPSTNNLYRNLRAGGRVKTARYKQWLTAMHLQIAAARAPIFTRPVAVRYTFARPDRRRRDLGNLEKPVSDLLVAAGVLADDSLIHMIHLEWVRGAPVSVEIREI